MKSKRRLFVIESNDADDEWLPISTAHTTRESADDLAKYWNKHSRGVLFRVVEYVPKGGKK